MLSWKTLFTFETRPSLSLPFLVLFLHCFTQPRHAADKSVIVRWRERAEGNLSAIKRSAHMFRSLDSPDRQSSFTLSCSRLFYTHTSRLLSRKADRASDSDSKRERERQGERRRERERKRAGFTSYYGTPTSCSDDGGRRERASALRCANTHKQLEKSQRSRGV